MGPEKKTLTVLEKKTIYIKLASLTTGKPCYCLNNKYKIVDKRLCVFDSFQTRGSLHKGRNIYKEVIYRYFIFILNRF